MSSPEVGASFWVSATVLAVFLGYFAVALAATILHRYRRAREAYLAIFFALVIVPGLTGVWAWPFFTWHLYRYRAPTDVTFYEIRVADGAGHELKYDARAVPPSLATPLTRFAARFPTYSPKHSRAFANYLLERARTYRARIETGRRGYLRYLRFPRHQLGFYWTKDLLAGLGPFEKVRIYRVHLRLSGDGEELLAREEQPVADYP